MLAAVSRVLRRKRRREGSSGRVISGIVWRRFRQVKQPETLPSGDRMDPWEDTWRVAGSRLAGVDQRDKLSLRKPFGV
jgi:hypothetical protein